MLRFLRWTLPLVFALAATTSSSALNRRPTISNAESCITDFALDRATWDCEGQVCACCYSDGCWICDGEAELGQGYGDCVWEQGFRPGTRRPFGGTDGALDPDAGDDAGDPGMTLYQVGPPATELEK